MELAPNPRYIVEAAKALRPSEWQASSPLEFRNFM